MFLEAVFNEVKYEYVYHLHETNNPRACSFGTQYHFCIANFRLGLTLFQFQVIERTNQARSKTGSLMSQLLLKKMISEDQFLDGLGVILDIAEDLLVDIPKLWDFLAQIVAPVLSSQAANMKILKSSSANLLSGDLGKTSAAGKEVY